MLAILQIIIIKLITAIWFPATHVTPPQVELLWEIHPKSYLEIESINK